MWTLTEKHMLLHIVGSAMENHHLKRSVLCIFFLFCMSFFAKQSTRAAKTRARFFSMNWLFQTSYIAKIATACRGKI